MLQVAFLLFTINSLWHLPRRPHTVGSAVSLAQAGATLVDMQVAGRWKSSQMPAHYAKAELAERRAIARFKDSKR